jgi:predicted amidophosphoribosyltransferase
MVRPSNSDNPKVAVGLQMFLRVNASSPAYLYGWQYKSKSVDVSENDKHQAKLFLHKLLEFGLSHESCLAGKLGLPQKEFDFITWVPSKSVEAPEHELGNLLRHSSAKSRVKPLLSFDSQSEIKVSGAERLKFNWKVSHSSESVPESVLLIDDMWTKGETMLSATEALLRSGVSRVGMLALGRHVNKFRQNASPDGIYEAFAKDKTLTEQYCALCDSRASMRTFPPLGEQYGQSPEIHKVELFRQKVEAAPDWSADSPKFGEDLVGSEVWCKEFKFGMVVEYNSTDESVQIDFGVFRFRRFPINHLALRWKPGIK